MKLPKFLVDHPDGEIRLTGHRIALTDIIYGFNEGQSPEMMALEYPTLPLALIYKVVAFYLEYQEECNAYALKQERKAERLRKKWTKNQKSITLADLRQRMDRIQKAQTKRPA